MPWKVIESVMFPKQSPGAVSHMVMAERAGRYWDVVLVGFDISQAHQAQPQNSLQNPARKFLISGIARHDTIPDETHCPAYNVADQGRHQYQASRGAKIKLRKSYREA